MTKLETLQLKLTATRVRMGVIEATHGAGCGHPGGSLSAADVLTYLYFREMRIDPEQPQDPNRDRFVLSKGHCAPGLYATLAERGFFPVADLPTLRHSNSYLQGHPNIISLRSVNAWGGRLTTPTIGFIQTISVRRSGRTTFTNRRQRCFVWKTRCPTAQWCRWNSCGRIMPRRRKPG